MKTQVLHIAKANKHASMNDRLNTSLHVLNYKRVNLTVNNYGEQNNIKTSKITSKQF